MFEFKIKNCIFSIEFPFFVAICIPVIVSEKFSLSLAAVLFHEFGHIVAMYLINEEPLRVKFHLFGIDIEKKREYGGFKNAFVSFSGPAVNLFFALFFYVLKDKSNIANDFFTVNSVFFIFHMLPFDTLDGGSILYSFMCLKIKEEYAEKIIFYFSLFVLIPVSVLGFYILLKSKFNYSLLLLSMYLIFSLLVKKSKF